MTAPSGRKIEKLSVRVRLVSSERREIAQIGLLARSRSAQDKFRNDRPKRQEERRQEQQERQHEQSGRNGRNGRSGSGRSGCGRSSKSGRSYRSGRSSRISLDGRVLDATGRTLDPQTPQEKCNVTNISKMSTPPNEPINIEISNKPDASKPGHPKRSRLNYLHAVKSIS